MAAINVSLFGAGPSRSRQLNAAERLNVYASPAPGGGIIIYSRPGLTEWLSLGSSPVRGWTVMSDFLYALAGRVLWRIAADGYVEAVGEIGTAAGRVEMAHNGRDLLIADGSGVGWRYEPMTGVFGVVPTWGGQFSVDCLGGFFATDSATSAEIFASDYISTDFLVGGSIPSTDFDRPKYIAASGDILYVFSRTSIEPWILGGQSYPFIPSSGGVIRYGLAAPASITEYQGSVTALITGQSETHLALLSGYQWAALSTEDIERAWSSYATVADAVCAAFTADAHPFLAVTFPTAGESWLYDGKTQSWARLSSGEGRFVGELGISFGDMALVSDWRSGVIYRVDLESRYDGDETFTCEIISEPLNIGAPFIVSDLNARIEVGETPWLEGDGSDPALLVAMADRGDWREWRTLRIGRQGERADARLTRWGQFRDLSVKIRLTSPARIAINLLTLEVSK